MSEQSQNTASAAAESFPSGTLAKLATISHALQGARDLLNESLHVSADDDGAKDGTLAIIELAMSELERINSPHG